MGLLKQAAADQSAAGGERAQLAGAHRHVDFPRERGGELFLNTG